MHAQTKTVEVESSEVPEEELWDCPLSEFNSSVEAIWTPRQVQMFRDYIKQGEPGLDGPEGLLVDLGLAKHANKGNTMRNKHGLIRSMVRKKVTDKLSYERGKIRKAEEKRREEEKKSITTRISMPTAALKTGSSKTLPAPPPTQPVVMTQQTASYPPLAKGGRLSHSDQFAPTKTVGPISSIWEVGHKSHDYQPPLRKNAVGNRLVAVGDSWEAPQKAPSKTHPPARYATSQTSNELDDTKAIKPERHPLPSHLPPSPPLTPPSRQRRPSLLGASQAQIDQITELIEDFEREKLRLEQQKRRTRRSGAQQAQIDEINEQIEETTEQIESLEMDRLELEQQLRRQHARLQRADKDENIDSPKQLQRQSVPSRQKGVTRSSGRTRTLCDEEDDWVITD